MILYHGSNVVVEKPEILKIQRSLDFGKGFYTTSDFEQAKKWAIRTQKIRNTQKTYVTVYEIDESTFKDLEILKFTQPDKKWLNFVTLNRKGESNKNKYDLIFGPVADDQTTQTIILFLDGFLTVQETLKRLLPQKLKDQYVFKTEKALNNLKFKEVIEL